MSKDSQPAICLEVVVPRIVSPISQPAPPGLATDVAEQHIDMQAGEAIGLSILRSKEQPYHPPPRDQETIEQTSTSHTKYRMHFRLFRLTTLPVSQPLLLRILHRARKALQHKNTSEQYLASDTYPVHLVFVPAAAGTPVPSPVSEPFMTEATHVEIVLDEEGAPSGYRIDGAEE